MYKFLKFAKGLDIDQIANKLSEDYKEATLISFAYSPGGNVVVLLKE